MSVYVAIMKGAVCVAPVSQVTAFVVPTVALVVIVYIALLSLQVAMTSIADGVFDKEV